MADLEKTVLTLGFIPLVDCAPLAVAKEQGFFEHEGLDVTLLRETSWANIRDKVMVGASDAAQMPAPMVLAGTLGVAGPLCPMVTPCVLNLGGNAITVSRELYAQMRALAPDALTGRPCSAEALKYVIDARRAASMAPLVFATVFPTSTHTYQLRQWLEASLIDPDRDVELRVVSPPHMVRALEAGEIAGYCVGEPWNSLAVSLGLGVTIITSYEIWNNAMEKVLGTTEAWAERHPRTLRALVRALIRASQWLEDDGNCGEASRILARSDYVGVPAAMLAPILRGQIPILSEDAVMAAPDFLIFHRYAANFPWRSQALRYAVQMHRAGQLPDLDAASEAVSRSYRTDIYRTAAEDLNVPVPSLDDKDEGMHAGPWLLRDASSPIPMGADIYIGAGCGDERRAAVRLCDV